MQEWEIASHQIMNQLSFGATQEEIYNKLIANGNSDLNAKKLIRFSLWKLKYTRSTIPELKMPF